MKQIPRLLGNVLVKIGKFPLALAEAEQPAEKVQEVRQTVRLFIYLYLFIFRFQLKKVLCMGTAVATVDHSEDEIRRNLTMCVNFLVSLLKKGWQNVKVLHIKTSMGKSYRIYG